MELKLGKVEGDFLRFRKRFNLHGALGIVVLGLQFFHSLNKTMFQNMLLTDIVKTSTQPRIGTGRCSMRRRSRCYKCYSRSLSITSA